MRSQTFHDKIRAYSEANPRLDSDHLGTLLLLDSLYDVIPEDVEVFRHRFAHLDPRSLENSAEGITFLKIARSDLTEAEAKEKLNAYLDIKYNYIGYSASYDENMRKFREHSQCISGVLGELLAIADLPQDLVEAFQEKQAVRDCHDIYELLCLYRDNDDPRIRYEILRKIGLIVLLSRIHHAWLMDDVDFALEKVASVFEMGLDLEEQGNRIYFLWLDAHGKVEYCSDEEKAASLHTAATRQRVQAGLPVSQLQRLPCTERKTQADTDILHMEMRTKFRKTGVASYTSFIEKFIRNNLEFPNQVHDVIGVRMVVRTEDEILGLITQLETFLGGASTRKKEKNSLHKFGRKRLSPYSSKDYYVWKAVYDIILPHPSCFKIEQLLGQVRNNELVQKELQDRLAYFRERQQDFVVEVQLQDIDSYLLSIAEGSPSEHAFLKMNQIRSNSFYKLFPVEIYGSAVERLRSRILAGGQAAGPTRVAG